MKKYIFSTILAILILSLFMPSAFCEQAIWDCPDCGRTGNTGNYCGGCGHVAPSEDETPKVPGFSVTASELINTCNSLLEENDKWTKATFPYSDYNSFPITPIVDLSSLNTFRETVLQIDSGISELFDVRLYLDNTDNALYYFSNMNKDANRYGIQYIPRAGDTSSEDVTFISWYSEGDDLFIVLRSGKNQSVLFFDPHSRHLSDCFIWSIEEK